MRDGTCPKCSGTEVYAARNGFTEHLHHIRPHLEPSFRGMARPHPTRDLWAYVCASCGFSETYLHDGAAIDFIRQSWMRVTPPAAPT
jgi:hypothetical protein